MSTMALNTMKLCRPVDLMEISSCDKIETVAILIWLNGLYVASVFFKSLI